MPLALREAIRTTMPLAHLRVRLPVRVALVRIAPLRVDIITIVPHKVASVPPRVDTTTTVPHRAALAARIVRPRAALAPREDVLSRTVPHRAEARAALAADLIRIRITSRWAALRRPSVPRLPSA
jgi:hypothetical protein